MIDWDVALTPVSYPDAIATMETRVAAIADRTARELVWLLEHPPLITAGTSARECDLLDRSSLPVFRSGRGGQYTYHGPGQRIGYVMVDLARGRRDVRCFVDALERWLIGTLDQIGVDAFTIPGRVGVWTGSHDRAAKIAAIGIRVRRWITYHGFALNIAPDLGHFAAIRPCGLDAPVTSLAALGSDAAADTVDAALAVALPRFASWIGRANTF